MQVENAKKMTSVGKVKVSRVVRAWEKRLSRCKGVIAVAPPSVNMRELVENLKVKNDKGSREKRRLKTVL